MATPEKLNLWDRFFNRYRKEVIVQNAEPWVRTKHTALSDIGHTAPVQIQYKRDYVDYKIIDRLTGSETIEREYLN